MRYALLIYSASEASGYAAGRTMSEVTDYVRAMKDAGVLVRAEQLAHTDTAASVRVDDGGRLVTDGPFMETKEHLLGFFLIDVPGLSDALDWAARMPIARRGTVEVREALAGMPWQTTLE